MTSLCSEENPCYLQALSMKQLLMNHQYTDSILLNYWEFKSSKLNHSFNNDISFQSWVAAYRMHIRRILRNYSDQSSTLKQQTPLHFQKNGLCKRFSPTWPMHRLQFETATLSLGRLQILSSTDAFKQLHSLSIRI